MDANSYATNVYSRRWDAYVIFGIIQYTVHSIQIGWQYWLTKELMQLYCNDVGIVGIGGIGSLSLTWVS